MATIEDTTDAVDKHFREGVATFGVPELLTLPEWAAAHFYLSKESSYTEQRWTAWPFQLAIMACVGNDAIRVVILRKSARVGFTKILLAAIGYFAEHKRRNQAVWRPTDDDRKEFVKLSLDPMLRDVPVMKRVFPEFLRRAKDNTLESKHFVGSALHLRGGRAARNYRDISIDNGYLDEYDAFDASVEDEGDPYSLAAKRTEGATFGKMVVGSTPKQKGFSNIEKIERDADIFLSYHIPCPECAGYHPVTWGGKDEPHGFKWQHDDPDTVRHLCPHCGALIDQAAYLLVLFSGAGRYQAADGTTLDAFGQFRDAAGEPLPAPENVAVHIWSAYSPNVSWPKIVAEFLSANREASEGKKEKLQTFVNTTLGEYWTVAVEQTNEDDLKARAEPYPLERVPRPCLLLLAGIDTQDNRLECVVWGYGRGCEAWVIAHRIFFGNPSESDVWAELEDFLKNCEFTHDSGHQMRIYAAAIDTQGRNTQPTYVFCAKNTRNRVFAVAGRSGREKHIKDGATRVDIDWRGRVSKRGLTLWWVGTNHAKDLIHGRLSIARPGPGYLHFSAELSDEFFKQFAGEARMTRKTLRGDESAWVAQRKRVEAWDCSVYATWLETHLDLGRKPAHYWDTLDARLQPTTIDMFADSSTVATSASPVAETVAQTPAVAVSPPAPVSPRRRPTSSNEWGRSEKGNDGWNRRL